MGHGEVGRVGHVDGDVEQGLGGGLDFRERSLRPDCGVLTYGRGG